MNIIFIRHGKSIDDTNGVSQRNESPLSQEGITQVKKRACDFKHLAPAAYYSSHNQRAQETASILFPGASITPQADIFEIRRPRSLDGGNHEAAVHFWEVTHKKDKYIPDWSYDESESFLDASARARTFMTRLMRTHHAATQPIIVVSHGGFIRHCIGTACLKHDDYHPATFFDLLFRLKIDNLDAITLSIDKNNKLSWYQHPFVNSL